MNRMFISFLEKHAHEQTKTSQTASYARRSLLEGAMIIPQDCLIYMVNTPISARYGIPTMFDMLVSNTINISWSGIDPVVIVTLNERRTICKVFVVDGSGYTCFTRKRASGRFQHKFNSDLLPTVISRRALDRLLKEGSLSGRQKY